MAIILFGGAVQKRMTQQMGFCGKALTVFGPNRDFFSAEDGIVGILLKPC